MRWVKASERLPSHIFGKIARFIHTKTILYDFIEWVKNSPDRLNEVEWLDESGAEQEGWSAETVVRAVRMELFGKDNISEFDDSQKDYFYGVKGIIESAMKNFPPPNQAWRRNANPLDAHPPSP